MSTFKPVILKGPVHKRSDGTYNIKIRLTHKRQPEYISTDLYVQWDQFDRSAGVAIGKNAEHINLRLTEKLLEYRKKDISLGDQRDYMTVKDIKKYLVNNNNVMEIDFFEFIDNHNFNLSYETVNQFKVFSNSLKKMTGNKLPVSNINLNFIKEYEQFLRKNNVGNGIVNYMTNFRTLFRKIRNYYNDESIGKLVIPHYPFASYEFPKRKNNSKKHNIPLEELSLFVNYNPENKGEVFTKDMCMLMIYFIGIEAKDLYYLKKPVKGRIQYTRFKTEGEFSIKVEPEAIQIIKKYQGEDEYLLNISKRYNVHKNFIRKLNYYLHGDPKEKITGIFPKLGIQDKVTTKWFRHTWASIARNKCKINKDDVALCLGHKDQDNVVTDMYIDYDYTIIDESNRKVIDFINGLRH